MAEGSRFYTQEGVLAPDVVPYADKKRAGEMRPATLTDAKKNGWIPSVSTILNVAANPGVVRYQINCAKQAVLEHPATKAWIIVGIPDDEKSEEYKEFKQYQAEVDDLAAAHSKKASDKGTVVHAWLQRSLEGKSLPELEPGLLATATAMLDAFRDYLGDPEEQEFEFDTEATFTRADLGFAGTPDVLVRYGATNWVVDWKTQGFDGKKRRVSFYEKWQQQIGAYGQGIFMNRPVHGLVVCGSTEVPGLVEIKPYSIPEMREGWEQFDLLRRYYLRTKMPEYLNDAQAA